MKTPFLLLGASLLFWGWNTGLLILAGIMLLFYEGARFIRIRWDLSDHDFRRISDLCTVLFVILLAYLIVRDRSANIILILLQWLPMVLFPLLITQRYSTREKLDISALFFTLRKKKKDIIAENKKQIRLNLSYPFYAVCVLSAGIANVRDGYYYAGLLLFALPLLWLVRSKRFSVILFLTLIALAGVTGSAGHESLSRLQRYLEGRDLEWFSKFRQGDADPFQTKTAIGDIGVLKPSSRIIFRVSTDAKEVFPVLLQEAGYNIYNHSRWITAEPGFASIHPDKNQTSWTLAEGPDTGSRFTVFSYMNRGEGLLKLPPGTFKVEKLRAVNMERHCISVQPAHNRHYGRYLTTPYAKHYCP